MHFGSHPVVGSEVVWSSPLIRFKFVIVMHVKVQCKAMFVCYPIRSDNGINRIEPNSSTMDRAKGKIESAECSSQQCGTSVPEMSPTYSSL